MQFVNRDTFYKKGQKIAKKERREYAEWRAEQRTSSIRRSLKVKWTWKEDVR
jgi:hypothetical protein